VGTLQEVPIHQGPGAMVAVVMAAQAPEIQQVVTQQRTRVAAAAREIMRPVMLRAVRVVLAS
jgi:hypothetical protein